MKRHQLSYLIDGALLVGACLLFFWRDLTPVQTDRWTFVPGDFLQTFYALAHYAASRLQNGLLPLWNPYANAGHPFLADIQSAVFYPPRLLSVSLASIRGFSYRTLELEAIVHCVLVAWFTYLLARRLTGSRVGGLVAAVAFTFSGYLTSYPLLQLAILETQTWLPLILLCLELAADRFQRGECWHAMRWAIAAGVFMSIALLAGHPQSGLLVGYASLAYGMFRLWPRPFVFDRRTWAWRLGLLAAFGLIGVGGAAVQLVPSWEFTRLSTRTILSFEESGTGFLPYDLIQVIFPAVGGQFPALYVGILPLGLVALALTAVRHDSKQPGKSRATIGFWGWGLLIGLLISFGKHVSLYQVFYLLAPGWKLFRDQERTIVWAVLAIALLSGYATAWLSRSWATMRSEQDRIDASPTKQLPISGCSPDRQLALGYCIGAACACALAVVFFVGYQVGYDKLWGFTTASLYLALMLFLCVIALRSRQPALLLALLAFDLLTITPTLHARPVAKADLLPFQSLVAIPQADKNTFRTANDDVLPGSYGLLYGLEDLKGASPLLLSRYDQWLTRVPTKLAWYLLNVRYVFSWQESLDVPAERIAEGTDPNDKPVYLYRLLQLAPRAWLVGQAIVEPDPELALQRLVALDFDPTRQVLLTTVPANLEVAESCGGTIAWHQRKPEYLVLSVKTDQPCILVLSELDYPGWQVTVNDKPATILKADVILRSLALSAGEHKIVFHFRPFSVYLGATVSIATIIGVGVLLLVRWLCARKK